MKHKSTQVLELEKALGFKLADSQFEVDEEGDLLELYLSKCKLRSIEFLNNNFNKLSIERFDIGDNLIQDVSPLRQMINLSYLHIGHNEISNIEGVTHLTNLRKLNICDNKITDIEALSNLKRLETLEAWGNNIRYIKPLESLNSLREIHISDNKINDTDTFRKLNQLENVSISSVGLRDVSDLIYFENLQYLNIAFNEITDLEPLVKPYLRSRNYKRTLSFSNNPIEDNTIYIEGNPLVSPPIEVTKQGSEAVITYFEEKGKKRYKIKGSIVKNLDIPLNEVRVIFLGQGQTGKTTLKKQLLGLPIPEIETQTDGIDIDVWQPQELDGIKLRLWDFGGQEIQHSVHKLFLQDNCVYVLLLNKRQDQQSDGNLIYWLNHIRSFGKNSPVLIVENFIDTVNGVNENSTPEQLAELGGVRNEIKQRYHAESAPLDYVGISAKKGYNLETFKQKLYRWAKEENNRGLYSPRWLAAKNQVEERITGGTELGGLARNNYITKETFDLECEQVEVVDPDAQDTILGVMLRLGVAFYFKKSENRKNWLVLNPEWVTVGIYSLILHPKVKELNGRLLRSDLEEILVNEDSHSFFSKKNYSYSEDELGYLLGLMQDYELCYTPNQNEFFLPTGFVRNYNSQFRNENPEAVAFFIAYDTLPQAIWFKFLVRLFKRQVVRQYWQEGIEVAALNANGLVEFLPLLEKKIKIWVSGKTDDARIELMRLLRYELDFVNEEFSNIQVTPKVFTEDGSEINYSDALAALYQNEPIKKGFESYNPLAMIQAVDAPEQTLVNVYRELQKTNTRIDDFARSKDEFILEVAKQLQKSGMVNLIINQNSNISINETRFELPRETNEFEGKLNFLIEELKDRETEQKLLQDLLEKVEELRLVPTKEEAVKKGFSERFKKFSEYLKTGTELSKSLKEIGNMVSVEDIKRGIDLILESMK